MSHSDQSRTGSTSVNAKVTVATSAFHNDSNKVSGVKMAELPFYDVRRVLIRPTSLISQSQNYIAQQEYCFALTPFEAQLISCSRDMQVHVRFCALSLSLTTQPQSECLPQSLTVSVNGKNFALPQTILTRIGINPKRPAQPLDITALLEWSPTTTTKNKIIVQWIPDTTDKFAMTIQIVRRLTANELFEKLKKQQMLPTDVTRDRIRESFKANEDGILLATSFPISVACPIGLKRMSHPCRAETCKHLQCFDAESFLKTYEPLPSSIFKCPVCDQHLSFADLRIDAYFLDVVGRLSADAKNVIELFEDGHWEPELAPRNGKKENKEAGSLPILKKEHEAEARKFDFNKTIELSSDSEDDTIVVEEIPATLCSPQVTPSSKRSASVNPVKTVRNKMQADYDDQNGNRFRRITRSIHKEAKEKGANVVTTTSSNSSKPNNPVQEVRADHNRLPSGRGVRLQSEFCLVEMDLHRYQGPPPPLPVRVKDYLSSSTFAFTASSSCRPINNRSGKK